MQCALLGSFPHGQRLARHPKLDSCEALSHIMVELGIAIDGGKEGGDVGMRRAAFRVQVDAASTRQQSRLRAKDPVASQILTAKSHEKSWLSSFQKARPEFGFLKLGLGGGVTILSPTDQILGKKTPKFHKAREFGPMGSDSKALVCVLRFLVPKGSQKKRTATIFWGPVKGTYPKGRFQSSTGEPPHPTPPSPVLENEFLDVLENDFDACVRT